MFTLAVIGQKGGTGKSCLSIGLAVAATLAGKSTVLVDLDPQATAAKWGDRREAEELAVVSAQASRLDPVLAAPRKARTEVCIIDTAGRSDDSALKAARAADLVLVPCRPIMVELESLAAVRDLLLLAGNPKAYVVLNGISPSATRQAADARDLVLESFRMQCAPAHLAHRAAYPEAMTTGQSPQETDPSGKAASELQRLYLFKCEHVIL